MSSSASKALACRQARIANPFPVGRGAIGVRSRTRREAADASTAGTVTYGRVERTVHFVYGLQPQREPFPLVHYLAVESARQVLRPDRVLFHVHELPSGDYWDRVRDHVELVHVHPLPEVTERCVDPLVARYVYAHHADVVRLDALLEYGGLYLDIDTVTIAEFPEDWWGAPFTIGREAMGGRPLLNAVMLAEPGAPFARAWRDRILGAMDGSWSAHSNQLAAHLANEMPDAVNVLPEAAFSRFGPTPVGLQALLMPSSAAAHPDLAGAYAFHLCQHLWWDRQRVDFLPWLAGADIDERYIRDGLSVYARCARRFLSGTAARPAAAGSASARSICYVGHDAPSGYGVAAHRAVRAMRGAELQVRWQPLHGGHDAAGAWRWALGDAISSADLGREHIGGRCEVLVGHTPPDHALYYRDHYRPRRYVAHTVWETDRIPPTWVPILNGSEGQVDAVVVPTAWNAAMFRAGGVETPIFVVPHVAVPGELREPGADLDLDVADEDFVFYMLSTWSPRKSIELAVDAYAKAFNGDDRVVLVIKADAAVQQPEDRPSPPPNAPERFAWWHLLQVLREHRDPPKVVLATEWWSAARVAALHRRGDCYFALPHGEGWGLGAFDAATLGTPVITTGWGGPLAYLGDDYPGLVSGRLVETTAFGTGRRALWCDPDIDHAVELLRAVVRDRGEGTSAFRRDLAERLAHECGAERVASLLATACGLPTTTPSRSLAPWPAGP